MLEPLLTEPLTKNIQIKDVDCESDARRQKRQDVKSSKVDFFLLEILILTSDKLNISRNKWILEYIFSDF